MEIYYIVLLLSLITYQLLNNKRIYFFVNFSLMMILSGCRHINVGTDTKMYHDIFYTVRRTIEYEYVGEVSRIEVGNRILMEIADILFNDPQGYIFLTALLTYIFFAIFLYNATDNKYYWIAVFLFISVGYFIETLNTCRQMLSVSIACNALNSLRENKNIIAIILITISLLFHVSSVVFFLPIFISIYINVMDCRANLIKILITSSLFVLGIVIYGGDVLLAIFNNFDILDSKYSYYLFTTYANTNEIPYKKIIVLGIIMLYYGLISYNKDEKKYVVTLYILLGFTMCFMILQSTMLGIFYRFYFSFIISLCALTPIALKNSIKELRLFMIVLLIIAGIFNMYQLLQVSYNVEYNTFF